MRLRPRAVLVSLILLAPAICAPGQQAGSLDRYGQSEMHQILHDAWHDVKAHYYDPTMHGLDWDARYHAFDARVSSLPSLTAGFALVGEFLSGLHDSHTYFAPPAHPLISESGFRFAPVGDACLITQVLPGSDAARSLSPGDELVALDGVPVSRANYEALLYSVSVIAPQASFRLTLRSPQGVPRQVTVRARILRREVASTEAHAAAPTILENNRLMFWRVPDLALTQEQIDRAMDAANGHSALVIDLRGNPGGSAETVAYLAGALFDRELTIGERIGRHGVRPLVAKPHRHAFRGKLIVLVDSGTSSAAEILARLVQIENRGTVVGDRTAGQVMGARSYLHSILGFAYGFSISEVRFVMSDGQSLEQVGVTPDVRLLPSGADFAAGRDPLLARAAALSGLLIDPVQAAGLLPLQSVAPPPQASALVSTGEDEFRSH